MGRLTGTVAFHRDPLGFLRSAQRHHGDVFTIRLATTGPVVVIAEPEAAIQLAALDGGAAGAASHAGEARRTVLPMASSRSIFGADGQQHRAARARAAAAFSPEALAERAESIEAIVRTHVRRWPRGRPIRLLPRMRELADEVFVREILGVEAEPAARRLAEAIGAMLRTPGNPPLSVPAREDGLLGWTIDKVYRRRREPVARLLCEEIVGRRTGRSRPGVLGLLLADEPQQSVEEIVEELLSLLMAAQEPIASALSWLALALAAAAEVRDRLAQERAGSDYERAVIEESLRLHPPALAMLRRLVEPATLADHRLEAGTSAMAPIPLMQRDGRRFADPDRFLPGRYLSASGGAPSATWPFGHGARACIAQPLARLQLAAMARALSELAAMRPVSRRGERMVLRATILVPQRSALTIL